jgi:hypothetical protein
VVWLSASISELRRALLPPFTYSGGRYEAIVEFRTSFSFFGCPTGEGWVFSGCFFAALCSFRISYRGHLAGAFPSALDLLFNLISLRLAGAAIQRRGVYDSRKRRRGWIVDYFPARIANTIRINPSKTPPGTMVISPRGSA